MHPLPLRQRSAWQALETHERSFAKKNLRSLFAEDPKRGERYRAEAEGVKDVAVLERVVAAVG